MFTKRKPELMQTKPELRDPTERSTLLYDAQAHEPAHHTSMYQEAEKSAAPPRVYEPAPFEAALMTNDHDELTDPQESFAPRDDQPETTLGKGVVFRGEISFNRYLRIDGTFIGQDISSDGKLVIGSQGSVEANIDVKTAIVEGQVTGNVRAQRLELRSGARLEGDITASALLVDEGVSLKGIVSVTPDEDLPMTQDAD